MSRLSTRERSLRQELLNNDNDNYDYNNINDDDDKKMSFLFQNWQVYKDARLLRVEINKILKTYPSEEKYRLVDQIKRAILSVILQIAEGSNRKTERDKGLFVNRALTSLDEVLACFDCSLDDRYITQKQYEETYSKIENVAKQLRAFGNHLVKNLK